MKISFCTTSKNRLYQLQHTLPVNLAHAKQDGAEVEFVLVDFGSTDETVPWVLQHFSEDIRSGLLRLFSCSSVEKFHSSICKNTAHRLALGDIVVNLDIDNFIGRGGVSHVLRQFEKHGTDLVYHQFCGDWGSGNFGRISCLKKHFDAIGGYNESFKPMGYQDRDLIARLKAAHSISIVTQPVSFITRIENRLKYRLLNKKTFRTSRFNRAIRNDKTESVADYGSAKELYDSWNKENGKMSKENINSGWLIANNGVFGAKEGILQYDHNGKTMPVNLA